MPSKAEMAAEIKDLTGEDLNPDDFKAPELEGKLADAKAAKAAEEEAAASGAEQINVRLSTTSTVGSLGVGDSTITRQGGTMTRADYDRLKDRYGLEEVKG